MPSPSPTAFFGPAPSDVNDPAAGGVFGFDLRLVPLIAALVLFCVGALLFICVCNVIRMRRMARFFLNAPHLLWRHEDVKPIMKTVSLEVDLEIGESLVEWSNIMPLSAEHPPHDDEKTVTKPKAKKGKKKVVAKDDEEEENEDQYVRITVLVALPSPLGRRNPNVVLDACLADAEGTRIQVPRFHQQFGIIPETAFGILQKRVSP